MHNKLIQAVMYDEIEIATHCVMLMSNDKSISANEPIFLSKIFHIGPIVISNFIQRSVINHYRTFGARTSD